MRQINWADIEEHEVVPGLYGKFFHAQNMTFAMWRFNEGADLPLHDHPHEQVVLCQEGKLELTVGNETYILSPGDVFPIRSGVPHSGKALAKTVAIDIFQPVREDFKQKYGE